MYMKFKKKSHRKTGTTLNFFGNGKTKIKNKQNHQKKGTNAHLLGPSFNLKFLVKKGHNSKYVAFKVMHLVILRKYSKFISIINFE